ncbi:MAG: metallophosphoesterase [Spirochaetes bacterium]|nr:metallophosphoesterase [Spirochaetota bacterium]
MARKLLVGDDGMHDKSSATQSSDAPTGISLVRKAMEIGERLPGRPRDPNGLPGGLIDLPEGRRPIIIGDLHAAVSHLDFILSHWTNRADMESGKAFILFLGDSLHDDRTGYMREMVNSLAMLNEVFRLIVKHPGRVYYLRGNHDTFDERLRKSGIAQGAEFRKALVAAEGEEYALAVGDWFESLPYFAIGNGYVVTHAGPVRGGCGREELIHIRRRPDYAMQLIWNRVNEFHGNPSPKEYCELDIRRTLDLLDLPEDTHFIVGHNPMWHDGGTTGLWQNVIGIRNHHIIYSGSGSLAPYYTLDGGSLVARMSKPQEAEVYYYG